MILDERARWRRIAAPWLLGLAAAGCAAPPVAPGTRVLVFGEQHDQPDHQRQVAQAVRELAVAGRLGAVVLEMAEQGRSTAALPRDADAAQVREALAWSGWDWPVYEDVVMSAVRAGAPVLGGNLPRARLRDAMADARQDDAVDADVRGLLAAAVRDGHCGLLPASQEPGMVRVQIARDRAMTDTVLRAGAPPAQDRVVVLLAGAQHASRDRGVPWHLQRAGRGAEVRAVIFGDVGETLAADEWRAAAVTQRPDPCEELRQKLATPRRAP